jgi:hypothetical protein
MKHHPLEVFGEPFALFLGHPAGVPGRSPKVRFIVGQSVDFQRDGLAGSILAHQDEIPVIGHQDLPVFSQVAAHLVAVGGHPGIILGGLDLNGPPGRHLPRHGFIVTSFLKLLLSKKPAIRHSGALVLQVDDAPDLGLQGFTDLIEKARQGPIIGGFLDGRAG